MSSILSESYSFIWQPKVRMKTFRGDAGALPVAGGLEFCMMVPVRVFIPWAEGLKPDFTKARKGPALQGREDAGA